jgi:hypothetical protein
MTFYKLTDEEIAKLPCDQFTEHSEMCQDANGVPEQLQVEFPATKEGTRIKLEECEGMTPMNLGSEERVLATLMGQHPRLGGNSVLRSG